MGSALTSLEEYLHTSYSPDCEYVDGVVRERHVGLRPHSGTLSNLIVLLWGEGRHVWPTVRLRTAPTRCRVPDVCVTVDDPRTDVFETPPFIVIEILAPEHTASHVLEKLGEYEAFGVRNIWAVDPWFRKAYIYRDRTFREVARLAIADDAISLPLDAVFDF